MINSVLRDPYLRALYDTAFSSITNYLPEERNTLVEIGAGNGISTKNFLDMLHMSNYNFHYTVNEYYQSYRDSLTKIVTNYNINYENKNNKNHMMNNKRKYENYKNENNMELFIMPFESLSFFNNGKIYDIILLTAASALNNNNIHLFKSLTHRDTIIITICPYCFTYVLRRHFDILDIKACSVILGIFLLQIKQNKTKQNISIYSKN